MATMRIDAFDAVFGGVAADAFVDDAVVIALCVEVGLEVSRGSFCRGRLP